MMEQTPLLLSYTSGKVIMQASCQTSMRSSKMVYDKNVECNSIQLQSLLLNLPLCQTVLLDSANMFLKSHLLLFLLQSVYERLPQKLRNMC